MHVLFTAASPYKKKCIVAAVTWTILLLIGCFFPASEIPPIHIKLIDKWVHMLLFAVFAFLWLCGYPSDRLASWIGMLAIAVGLGCFIEVMQGILSFLGRSCEIMDAVADAIGAIIGIMAFAIPARRAMRQHISFRIR